MSKLFDLETHKTKNIPHWVGLCLCVKCFNRWTATFPDGTPLTKFECPECGECESFVTILPPDYGEAK